MKISACAKNGILHIVLDGEMDEHSAFLARRETDRLIDLSPPCERAYIHLEKVSFMDSTGIGFLIGRYKKLQRLGMECYLKDPNPTADKVLSLGGIYSLMPKI